MIKKDPKKSSSEVTTKVFSQFLGRLEDSGIPADVVKRLSVLLLSDKTLTEKAVGDALFSEEPLP